MKGGYGVKRGTHSCPLRTLLPPASTFNVKAGTFLTITFGVLGFVAFLSSDTTRETAGLAA